MKESGKQTSKKNKVKIDIELAQGLKSLTYQFADQLQDALQALPEANTAVVELPPEQSGFSSRETVFVAGREIGRFESSTLILVFSGIAALSALAQLIYMVCNDRREKDKGYPRVTIQIKPKIQADNFISIEGKDVQEIEELLKKQTESGVKDMVIFQTIPQTEDGTFVATKEGFEALKRISDIVQEE